MNKYRFLFSLLVALLIAFLPIQTFGAEQSISLTLDGKMLQMDAKPLLKDNRTLIPIRVLSEDLGLKVDWNSSTQTATILDHDQSIHIKAGSNEVTVNGVKEKIEVPAMINKERIYVPLRFIMETYGLEVNWEQKSRTVHLQSKTLVENIDELLEKLFAVELHSFTTDMTIKEYLKENNEIIEMSLKTAQDIVIDPFGFHEVREISTDEEVILAEMYVTDQGMFAFNSHERKWVYLAFTNSDELPEFFDLVHMVYDQVAQLKFVREYLTEISIYDKGSHYIMYYSMSNDGYKQLIGDSLDSIAMLDGRLLTDLTYGKMIFSIIFDKETFYPISFSSHTELTINNENTHATIEVSGNYRNINSLDPITIPKEVLENAKRLNK